MLIEALADPEPFVRWQASEALAAQDATCVFHALTDALTEGQPPQRAGAAAALGRIGGEAATTALGKQVEDPDPRVRRALAQALGQIGDPTTAVELVPMLDDADADVRRAAAHALGQIGSPGTAVPLAEALARPDQPLLVRRSLAAALASAAHPDAQPVLLAALADPDPQVRGYAAEALGHIGNEVAYERLAELLADRSPLLKGTVGDEARAAPRDDGAPRPSFRRRRLRPADTGGGQAVTPLTYQVGAVRVHLLSDGVFWSDGGARSASCRACSGRRSSGRMRSTASPWSCARC